jgi:hypothetical protein
LFYFFGQAMSSVSPAVAAPSSSQAQAAAAENLDRSQRTIIGTVELALQGSILRHSFSAEKSSDKFSSSNFGQISTHKQHL